MAHLSHDCLVDCPRARHTIAHTYSSGVASRTPRPRIASLPSSSLAHVLSWSLSREYTYLRARLHAFACAAPALWTTTSSYWSTTPPTPPLAPTSSCGARASSVSNPLTMCTSGLVVRDELDRSRRGRRSTLSSGLEVTLLGRTALTVVHVTNVTTSGCA